MQRWSTKFTFMRTEKQSIHRSESGVFLVLFCILIFLLIGLIGFAVDLTLVASAKLNLRYIVDNTLMNAPIMVLAHDYDTSEVKDRLTNLSKANLELDGYGDRTILDITYDVQDTEIQASAKIKKGLSLSKGFVTQSDSLDLNVESLLKLPRVNLLILYDYSRSMLDIDTFKPTQNKMTTALGGIAALSKWLRPSIDRVALVNFSDFAKLAVPFESDGGYSPKEVVDKLLDTSFHSWSNLNDALRIGLDQFKKLPVKDDEVNLLAVYSDLRANAGLLNFDSSAILNLPPTSTGFQYYTFPAKMTDFSKLPPDINFPTGLELNKVKAFTLRKFPLSSIAPWLPQKPACELGKWDIKNFAGIFLYYASEVPDITACLKGSAVVGPYVGIINSGLPADNSSYFIQQSLTLAIDQADAIRNLDVSVYTVMLGTKEIGPSQVFPGALGSMVVDDFSFNYLNRFNLNSKSLLGVEFPGISEASPLFTSKFKNYTGDWFQAHGSLSFGVDEASRLIFGRVNFDLQY
jgi:hypothetical protein